MLRFFFIFMYILPLSSHGVEKVIIWERLKTYPFPLKILEESLRVTEKQYGKTEILPSIQFQQGEALDALILGETMHVASLAPTKRRMSQLIAVPIPLTRGMLGMRVCFINKADKALFKAVRSVADLNKFGIKFAVGSDWPDKEILLYNDLKIIESDKYENLFNITKTNSKVCFSRSLNEIISEEKFSDSFNLEVESSLIILYDLPNYFFVSKSRPQLAKRIELGMKILRENGEFYKYFWENFADVFQKFKIKNRKVIRLKVPVNYVSDEVKSDPLLWLPARMKK